MTESLQTPAAPAAPAVPVAAPGGPPAGEMTMDDARQAIEVRKNDKDFRTRLLARDPETCREWDRLHKAGFPAPPQIASAADVNLQAAARAEQEWGDYFAALKQRFELTPENEAEVRRGVVRADIHAWAIEEKGRMIGEKGFLQKLRDGERKANLDWGRVTLIIGLRPVKVT